MHHPVTLRGLGRRERALWIADTPHGPPETLVNSPTFRPFHPTPDPYAFVLVPRYFSDLGADPDADGHVVFGFHGWSREDVVRLSRVLQSPRGLMLVHRGIAMAMGIDPDFVAGDEAGRAFRQVRLDEPYCLRLPLSFRGQAGTVEAEESFTPDVDVYIETASLDIAAPGETVGELLRILARSLTPQALKFLAGEVPTAPEAPSTPME
ncbi:hypothetical protein [Brevibacterium litoralis]|uniref:hypothetical protein n=1 Tax=Brevibacterium litoralis TaxID=3138935 RepID=UPI0032ED7BAA